MLIAEYEIDIILYQQISGKGLKGDNSILVQNNDYVAQIGSETLLVLISVRIVTSFG